MRYTWQSELVRGNLQPLFRPSRHPHRLQTLQSTSQRAYLAWRKELCHRPDPRPFAGQPFSRHCCRTAFSKARWLFAGRSLGPSAGQPFLRHLFDPAARSSQPQMETILNLLQSWKANPVPTEFACKMLYRLELVESDSAVIIRIILQLFPCYLWLPPMISCYFTVMFHSCWLF